MSHTATIKGVKIQSITALEATIKELNTQGIRVSLTPNATPRAYFTDQKGMGKADFVINVLDCKYDIGLYKQEDGSYEPRTDFWGGHIEKIFGIPTDKTEMKEQAKMGKLLQTYGLNAAQEVYRKQGKATRRQTTANGQVQLIVTGF